MKHALWRSGLLALLATLPFAVPAVAQDVVVTSRSPSTIIIDSGSGRGGGFAGYQVQTRSYLHGHGSLSVNTSRPGLLILREETEDGTRTLYRAVDPDLQRALRNGNLTIQGFGSPPRSSVGYGGFNLQAEQDARRRVLDRREGLLDQRRSVVGTQ